MECGTSFGVSTIYLALAISRNAGVERKDAFGVLTMEKDASKMKTAREIWAEAGHDVEDWITFKEGDLLQTLTRDEILPKTIDLLFLDGLFPLYCSTGHFRTDYSEAWTSLALPALKLVLPRLRHGSLVFADKTTSGKHL